MKCYVKELRQSLGLTQEKFAERLGLKRGAITNYEVGRNVPSDAVLSLMCREFGVRKEWILTGQGEMYDTEKPTSLKTIIEEKGLSDNVYIAVSQFLRLDPAVQEQMIQYMVSVVKAIQEKPEAEPELDIDAEVEKYRQQLEAQKNQKAKSSQSNGGRAGTA